MPWLGNSAIIWVIQKNQKDVMSTASRTMVNAKKYDDGNRTLDNDWSLVSMATTARIGNPLLLM